MAAAHIAKGPWQNRLTYGICVVVLCRKEILLAQFSVFRPTVKGEIARRWGSFRMAVTAVWRESQYAQQYLAPS